MGGYSNGPLIKTGRLNEHIRYYKKSLGVAEIFNSLFLKIHINPFGALLQS